MTGVSLGSSSFGDVDYDGNLDLLITGRDANDEPTATLYLGDGSGGFTEQEAGLTGVRLGSSSFADLNNDGALDLIITGLDSNNDPTATLYLGDGSGGFAEQGAGLSGVLRGSSSVGDVDGNGTLDLLITGSGTATLYIGDGSGGFTEQNAGLTGVSRGSSAFADVDQDGDLDLLITGQEADNDPTATLYLGDGTGGFTEQEAGLTGVRLGSSSFADVDNDGTLDLIITGLDSNNDPTATLYLGDGSGGFAEQRAGLSGVWRSSSAFGDVDKDGNLDLLITGQDADNDPTATLYLGDASGGFTEQEAGLTGVRLGSSSFADVDNDGTLDLVITGSGTATLYENLASGAFLESTATQSVTGDGTIEFGSTGASVQFEGTSGTGDVTVQRFSNGPNNPLGIGESSVSTYRFAISAAGNLTFADTTELRLDVSTLRGISDAASVTVYKRSVRGNGHFNALPTSYDAEANELVAATGSFSEFVLASDTEPLPVELTSFKSINNGSGITLRWTTASETNNAGFAVEHREARASGAHRAGFTASWQELGFVASKAEGGTATEPHDYRFRAEQLDVGTHRFRLKQVDTDGSTNYSRIIEASVQMRETYRLSTYPNPATQQATVEVAVRKEQAVRLALYDVLGRRVATLHDGPLPAQQTTTFRLDTDRHALSSGSYFLHIVGEDFTGTRRLTILR